MIIVCWQMTDIQYTALLIFQTANDLDHGIYNECLLLTVHENNKTKVCMIASYCVQCSLMGSCTYQTNFSTKLYGQI